MKELVQGEIYLRRQGSRKCCEIDPFLICMVIKYGALLSVRTIYLPLPPALGGVWANAHCYIVSALYTVV